MVESNGRALAISNPLGCRLDFCEQGGKYGLGAFSLNGVPLGGTSKRFLREDTHYVWEDYVADKYEILQDSGGKTVVMFSGAVGYAKYYSPFTVTITLPDDSSAFLLQYDVTPYENTCSHMHPLYVEVPFYTDKMCFVQYPYEVPFEPGSEREERFWQIVPRMSKVPYMFGCQKIDGQQYYLGLGYVIDNQANYTKGRLVYDADKKEVPFRAYFPYSWLHHNWSGDNPQNLYVGSRELEDYPCNYEHYLFDMVVSVGTSQHQAISAYRGLSGYDVSTPIIRRAKDVYQAFMRGCRDAPEGTMYVKGKGFRRRGWADDNGGIGDYYAWVELPEGLGVCYMLYKLWIEDPTQAWAKEKAEEMIEYNVSIQRENGSIPYMWDEEKQRFVSCNPDQVVDSPEKDYIYNTTAMGLGAIYLHKTYQLACMHGENHPRWKECAFKLVEYLARACEASNGVLGAIYRDDGQFDQETTQSWVLMCFDYFHSLTGDERFSRARDLHESYVYANYAFVNLWCNCTNDDRSWRPWGQQLKAVDYMDPCNFAAYAMQRYTKTGEEKYLGWSLDVCNYLWLITIPVQLPEFTHRMKGLVQEQQIWSMFDGPWLINTLRYMGKLSVFTGDAFYSEFYKMLGQTMASYQAFYSAYPFFSIGLVPSRDREGPVDVVGETHNGRIGVGIIPFGAMYVLDLDHSDSYRYVGGPDWGVGLDYVLAFQPCFSPSCYLAACSFALCDARYAHEETALYLTTDETVAGEVLLRCTQAPEGLRLVVNGVEYLAKQLHHDANLSLLTISL